MRILSNREKEILEKAKSAVEHNTLSTLSQHEMIVALMLLKTALDDAENLILELQEQQE